MTQLPLLLLAVACTPEAPPEPPPEPEVPDLVLVTLDTTRADRLGAYGDPEARTPHLDELAGASALFREAWSPVPLTLPAHASMLSGRYPHRHGLRDNGGWRLADDVPLVSEILSRAGYSTGAFVAAYVLDGAWGLDRGFDAYGDGFHPEDVAQAVAFGEVERPAREVVRQALSWWDEAPRPRFLWVHLYEPHHPYEPPEAWEGDPYRGEIWDMDRALRPLLTAAGEEALVVVAGDHGESLWDGGELQHGLLLTRSALRVPLLVRPPGGLEGAEAPPPRDLPPRPAAWAPVQGLSPEGLDSAPTPDAPRAAREVGTPVSLVDLAPTQLAWAGQDCPDCDGRSLRPAVEGRPLEPVPVYSETLYPMIHYGWAPGFSARDDRRWLLRTPGTAVVDPSADPWAARPLDEEPPAVLVAAIDTHAVDLAATPGPVDAGTMAQLQELGYATAAVERPEGPGADPADRVHLVHQVALAQGRMASSPEEAEAMLEEVLARDPGLVDAWFTLGVVRLSLADGEGALAAFDEVLALAPTHALALNNKALVQRNRGLIPEALETTAALQALNPQDPRWIRLEVSLHARQEAPDRVLSAAERGLELVPDDPYLHYMRGLSLLQQGRPREAIRALESARSHGSRAEDLSMWMGKAYEEVGEVDPAVEAYHEAANAMPADVRPVVAAGMLLSRSGRCPEALPFLLTALERGVRDQAVIDAYEGCGGAI